MVAHIEVRRDRRPCEHEWRTHVITPQLETCRHCGIVRSRDLVALLKRPAKPRPLATHRPGERRFAEGWALAQRSGEEHCFWCRLPFTAKRPPTLDHVRPKSHGGRRGHGIVLACQLCNGARGDAPFDLYLEAVEVEREAAEREQREYRRPKTRHVDGEAVVTTLTRREWRAHRRASNFAAL